MTFNWLGAFQCVVFFGIPATLIGMFVFFSEGYDKMGVVMLVLFFLLAFLCGGIPWEVA